MGFIFGFISRLVKLSIRLILYLVVFATLIVLIPNLPPYTKFTTIQLAPTQHSIGPLTPNQALNNAEHKYKGKVLGPEAFQELNGELYTSLATGEIVKVSPAGHVTFVTKIGKPCAGLYQEHICGRPLGFQIDDQGKFIYVVDTYHGIWKVDLKTDKKQLLVSPRKAIENREPKLFNSIALLKNGDFYWTDSSSDYQLKDGLFSCLVDPSGRLLHYSAANNESKVLIDGLWFANGLAVSPNNDFIVVAETFKYRLVKYYLTGPKKGKSEAFVEGLPGTPDNVRVLPDGSGIMVGMYTLFDAEHPLITHTLAATPAARKFAARISHLVELMLDKLNSVFPNVIFEEIAYYLGNFATPGISVPPLSGLLQVDWNGNIVALHQNTDKSLMHISDAIVYNDKLYIGSPVIHDYIGVVPAPPLLKKAFQATNKAEAPKVDAKPQQHKPAQQAPKEKLADRAKEQPKVEEKPKAQPKVEEPKQKPQQEQKKEGPKVTKPVETKPPQAKPAEVPKPTPKPATPTPKPTPAAAKPEAPKQAAPSPSTTPKPQVKTTPPSKEKVTPPPPKPTTVAPKQNKKTDTPVKHESQKSEKAQQKPEQIPIKEEIPSDTAKPNAEKLKVIKKAGPTEIPVPKQ